MPEYMFGCFSRQKTNANILSNLLNGYGEDSDDNSLDYGSADDFGGALTTPTAAVEFGVATLEDKRAQPERESEKNLERLRFAESRDPR